MPKQKSIGYKISIIILLVGIMFFWASSYSFAKPSLAIIEPADQLITYDPVIKIQGASTEINRVTINGILIDVDKNGNFEAGLKLKPGKNFVIVSALSKEGKDILQTIRILRLVTFPDIEGLFDGKEYWAKRAAIDLATLQIIEGYPDGNFYPKRWASRGEFATWLARALGLPLTTPTKNVYFDVPKEHWRAPFIKAVSDAGYMKEFDDDSFKVDDAQLREEAIKVFGVALKIKEPEKTIQVFKDVPVGSAGAKDIYAAYLDKKIIGISKTDKIFDPSAFITRAQTVALFSRAPNVEKMISGLYDFSFGYDDKTMCKINTAPVIEWVKVSPGEMVLGKGAQWLTITAKIIDKQGLSDISIVKTDLTEIGGPPDAELFDDGTRGDESKGDGIFSLKLIVNPTTTGEKKIEIEAIDRSTWKDKKSSRLMIVK